MIIANNPILSQSNQGKIIEERKIGPSINFNLPKIHVNHSTYLSIIGGLSFLAVIFSLSYKIYIVSSNLDELIAAELPTSTGAILSEKTPEQIDINNITEDLISLCPINTDAFSIQFSYITNSFIVLPKGDNKNYQEQFLTWLNNSNYRILPANYFTFD